MEINKIRQIKDVRQIVELLSDSFKPHNNMRDVFYAVWEKNNPYQKWMIVCECYLTYNSEEFKEGLRILRQHFKNISFFCCYVVYLENWKKLKEKEYEIVITRRK